MVGLVVVIVVSITVGIDTEAKCTVTEQREQAER